MRDNDGNGTVDTVDSWLFHSDQLGFGALGQSKLALVHGVCGSKPFPIITHSLVFDGEDPGQGGAGQEVLTSEKIETP